MKKNYAFLLCVLFLAACGKTNKAEIFADNDRIRTLNDGELYKNVTELLASEESESCDRVADPMMRELTRVLDAKVDEINKLMVKLPASKTNRLVPFGKSYLKEYIIMPEVKDEWTSESESWSEMYTLYQEIKDKPMSRDWINLNSGVRSLITNDQFRILDGVNLDLHHDSEEKINSLKKVVDICIADINCKIPLYSKEDESFILNVGFYNYYYKKIETTHDRIVLEKFQKRLLLDQKRFAFRFNSSIKVMSENEKNKLELPVDGSIFTDQQLIQLQGYIENVWKSEDLSLKIIWVKPMLSVFKMFFDFDKPGERAYVSWQDGEVHLFPMTRTRAVAHEFGHVIGFKDHYYTTWIEQNCEYLTEGNSGDLMSDVSGNVTASEWDELKKSYLK